MRHTSSAMTPQATLLSILADCKVQILTYSWVSASWQAIGTLVNGWWALQKCNRPSKNMWIRFPKKLMSDASCFSILLSLSSLLNDASWIFTGFDSKTMRSTLTCADSIPETESLYGLISTPSRPWLYFLVILVSRIFQACPELLFIAFYGLFTLRSSCRNFPNRQLIFSALAVSSPFLAFHLFRPS